MEVAFPDENTDGQTECLHNSQRNFSAANNSIFVLDNLQYDPFQYYTILVAAFTAKGTGQYSNFTQMTGESGMFSVGNKLIMIFLTYIFAKIMTKSV